MTSNATSALFDVNVWLALSHPVHPHHALALSALAELPQGAFCRLTQLALLRLLTRQEVMGPDTQTAAGAWKIYHRFVDGAAAIFLEEPEQLEDGWRQWSVEYDVRSANTWSDAYLAAFAQCAGVPFVTFDRGFKRFAGLDCRVL
jgi:uncharacterized protein